MGRNVSCYEQLSEKELGEQWKKHYRFISGFLQNNKYDNQYLLVDDSVILTIIVKVDQRRSYFEYFHQLKMSEFKEVALFAFWIVKLRPLSFRDIGDSKALRRSYTSLNEKLALYYIIRTLRIALREKGKPEELLNDLPREYINELIYTFTYRDISKEAFIMLVESIAVFLGLNPYVEIEP